MSGNLHGGSASEVAEEGEPVAATTVAPPTSEKKLGSIDKLKNGISHDLMGKAMDVAEKASTKGKVSKKPSKDAKAVEPPLEDMAPFELICNFLTALMMEDYMESLSLCKAILQYEPNNRIVLEFRTILEELIKNPDMSLKNKSVTGENSDSNDEDTDGIEHCLSNESMSSFSEDDSSWSSCSSTPSSSGSESESGSCSESESFEAEPETKPEVTTTAIMEKRESNGNLEENDDELEMKDSSFEDRDPSERSLASEQGTPEGEENAPEEQE